VPATEWYQRYLLCYLFSISNSGLLFFHVCQPGRTPTYKYRTSDVAENLGRFLVRSVHPRNDFELILTVKMLTRHPVEGYFGSEFRTIFNHCLVMAAWSRKTLKFCVNFLRFFGKTTSVVKFLKLCSESFHCDTDRRCCVQISWNLADGKSVKSCVIYLTKDNRISPVSQTVAIARIAPKIC